MATPTGSGPQQKRTIAALLAMAVVLVVAAASGVWVGSGGLFGPERTPETIYVYETPGPTATASSPVDETPAAEASASLAADPSLTADPTVTAAITAATAPTPAAPLVTPIPAGPDLQLGTTATPALICNRSFHMWATIHNGGTAATVRSTPVRLVDFYTGVVTYTGLDAVPVLAAGADYLVQWDITVGTGCGGHHTLLLTIDPDNLIPEANESNNTRTWSYTLTQKPDLLVPAIGIYPADPDCAEDFIVTVQVRNYGSGATPQATSVRVVDTWNGTEQKSSSKSVPILVSGGTYSMSFSLSMNLHCGSTHRITAYVDPNNEIAELDETNNSAYRDYVP